MTAPKLLPKKPSRKVERGTYTFADFCKIVKEDQKADLIDGVIYMASPENFDHHRLYLWLVALMDMYADKRGLGVVVGSRFAFRLGEKESPEPDVAFVRKDRVHLFQKGFFDGPPDLAVEIISPESVERDYEKKWSQYEKAGVAEYWIIDEQLREIRLLRLGTRGKYREIKPQRGEFRSEALPGFYLRPEWLWPETRPDKQDVLALLLK
jgi:Uma2 family endonuclease